MGLCTGLALCFGVLFVSINCETYSQCQNKPSGIYLAGQKGCRSYIYCNGDRSYEGNCPVGLFFNPVDGTCDDPKNVQCFEEIITPTPPRPTPPAPKVICPTVMSSGEVAFVASPESCTNYYMCVDGSAMPMTCSRNLHFNSLTNTCEPPESANCKIAASSVVSTLATTTRVATPTWSPTTLLPTPPAWTGNPTGSTPNRSTPPPTWSPTQTGNPTGTTWAQSTTPPWTGNPTGSTPTWSTPRPPTQTANPTGTTWAGSTTPPWTGNPTGSTPTWSTPRPPTQTANPTGTTWAQPTTAPWTGNPTGSTPTWSTPRPPTQTANPTGTTWGGSTTAPWTGNPTGSTPTWTLTPLWPSTTTPTANPPGPTTTRSTTPTPTWTVTPPSWSSTGSTPASPPTTTGTTSPATVAAEIICKQQSFGYLPYPNDCHYFYRCLNGVLTKQACPSGFGWDSSKQLCTSSGCSA